MRTWLFTTACILVVALACSEGLCQDNRCPDASLSEISGFVHAQSGFSGPLHSAQMPSLNDDLIDLLKTKQHGEGATTEVPVVYFYNVSPAIYEVRGNRIVSENVELDANHEWLVAMVDPGAHKFLLQGSADPNSEFNKFVEQLGLKISDSDAALDVFDFYLKLAFGQSFRSRALGDEMRLEAVALEDFSSRFSTEKRRAAFERWWKGVSVKIKKEIVPPAVLKTKTGFEVNYYLYDQGEILVQSVIVSDKGSVAKGQSKTLYSAAH